MGLEVDDRQCGTTGWDGNMAAGHFDAISERGAKSKLFDRVRKVLLPHTHAHTSKQAHKLSGRNPSPVPSENK